MGNWLEPERPVNVGDWVSSEYYRFAGGKVIMDLDCGMVRVKHDRREITAKRILLVPATPPEVEDAERRLARIEAERAASAGAPRSAGCACSCPLRF